uniref:Uncharacterized protein n=1 Tax=Mesocestoides corti TaxID=53468 RepID=A0A5K3FWL2_MESCO
MDLCSAPRGSGKQRSGISPAVPPRICSHLSATNITTATADSNSPFPCRKSRSTVEPPTGLAVDSLTSSQQQTMFNCLGKGSVQSSPCVENATSAGRRHTLGGSTIDPPPAAMRHVNPPHPHNFAQSSASRPVQKVSCSMWNSQTGPSSPTTSSQGDFPALPSLIGQKLCAFKISP